MPISIIKFQGGLGNQMFQYAFFIAMRKCHPLKIYLFDTIDSQSQHQGFELFKLFPIKGQWCIGLYRIFNRIVPNSFRQRHTIEQSISIQYQPEIIEQRHFAFTIFSGYWQSEKYFQSVAKTVRKSFVFNTQLLNAPSRKLTDTLLHKPCVSIHIRRGDYLQNNRYNTCNLDYYKRAFDFINERYPCITPIFFSDDMDWVKEQFPIPNAIFVDWNQGPNSWQDMYLMSQCWHNIIANSSFSWWGAWLNTHSNKVVIAPHKWFNGELNHDIIPSSWIQL